MLHRPQWRGSLVRFAHWAGDPHEVLPAGQPHTLFAHTIPPVHLTPQAPQWLLSEVMSAHAPPQLVRPALQLPVQAPWLHTWGEVQVPPQRPQLAGSARRSTHTPLHSRLPAGH
jgi:hypothetical protein